MKFFLYVILILGGATFGAGLVESINGIPSQFEDTPVSLILFCCAVLVAMFAGFYGLGRSKR